MQEWSGQVIGRYEVLEGLGEGGMASVYKARDTRLGREVALKVIRSEQFGTAVLGRMLSRFEREARALAKLMHPNIIGVIDYGQHEGSPYLVMPYLAGGTLKQALAQHAAPMSCGAAARLLLPIARALAYAHAEGIIHRDVKPANILLTKSGQPMLADFGIAKILEGEEITHLTGTGMGVGTPEYMAPEQWQGKSVPQTDIYALGVVLYEMVTGRKPYTADTPGEVFAKQLTEELPNPRQYAPGLPGTAVKVMEKALAKKPHARYADMGEFAAALEEMGREQRAGGSEAHLENTAQTPSPQPGNEGATYDPLTADVGEVRDRPGISLPKWGWGLIGGGILLALGLGVVLLLGLAFANSKAAPALYATRTPIPEISEVLTILTPAPSLTFTPARTQTPTYTSTPRDISTPSIPPTPQWGTGSTQVSDVDGMVMVYVPAGDFLMGSPDSYTNPSGLVYKEKPQHTVYLDAYWIDRTEVTNAMYAQCVAAGECSVPSDSNSYTRQDYYGNSKYMDYPVTNVDWDMGRAYCAWAGRRLPTEAEWEKAARGTDGRIYPWGDQEASCSLANRTGCVGDTTAVGSYLDGASPYGALDMAGNVWEWVNDWFGEFYYSSSPRENPQGPSSGSDRLLRGGSWFNYVWYVRSAYREVPGIILLPTGFRCVSSP